MGDKSQIIPYLSLALGGTGNNPNYKRLQELRDKAMSLHGLTRVEIDEFKSLGGQYYEYASNSEESLTMPLLEPLGTTSNLTSLASGGIPETGQIDASTNLTNIQERLQQALLSALTLEQVNAPYTVNWATGWDSLLSQPETPISQLRAFIESGKAVTNPNQGYRESVARTTNSTPLSINTDATSIMLLDFDSGKYNKIEVPQSILDDLKKAHSSSWIDDFNSDGKIGQGIHQGGMMLNGIVNAIHPVENTKQSLIANGTLDTISAVGSNVPGIAGAAISGAAQTTKLIGNLASTNVDLFKIDENLAANQESSYGGAFSAMRSQKGGTYDLWSLGEAKKLKKLLERSKQLLAKVKSIDNKALDWFSLANDPYSQIAREVQLKGLNLNYAISAKEGIKLEINSYVKEVFIDDLFIEEFKQGGIIKEIEIPDFVIEVDFDSYLVQEFQNGGSFNIIPEGALHARLHHMNNAEKLTKKGIPVVSEGNNGELELQAEIEREEIIFRLEATQKIESLYRKYNSEEYTLKEKDLFAIEVGKFLVHEILNKTIDHTNNLL